MCFCTFLSCFLSVLVCQISDLSERCSSERAKVCPDGQLQCGNGECIGVEFFCDKKPDCSDGRFLQSFFSTFKSCLLFTAMKTPALLRRTQTALM